MPIKLTHHERHARLVKIVRRTYQDDNPGSRLFPNTSGVAWQGNAQNGAGKVELINPRPIRFGIPEPDGHGEKSGGTDLLGETEVKLCNLAEVDYCFFGHNDCGICLLKKPIPVITGIECKTGKARLKKNQKVFRDFMKKIGAVYFLARECPCQDKWEPVYKSGKIIEWEIGYCENCEGKGFLLENE